MMTPKEAANILGLSSDPKTVESIQQVRLDAYRAGLMLALQIASDELLKNQLDYCPADYPLPKDQYFDGLSYKVTDAILRRADNATVGELRQD